MIFASNHEQSDKKPTEFSEMKTETTRNKHGRNRMKMEKKRPSEHSMNNDDWTYANLVRVPHAKKFNWKLTQQYVEIAI